jgi:lysophospholipase L1-like esterase
VIQSATTLLFQGDSITNAFRRPEEVCNAYQLGAGYAMLVAAQTLAAQPAAGLTILNRGVSGEGVCGLQKRWQADCLDLRPDLLSILVGVNDAICAPRPSLTADAYAQQYRELLTTTRQALPNVRLVLCEPFALPVGEVTPVALAAIGDYGSVVRELARDFGATLVPLQQTFADAQRRAPAAYWAFDGIHPTAQGHWLLAQAWLAAVAGASVRSESVSV